MGYGSSSFNDVIGKKIKYVHTDETTLTLNTEDGDFVFNAFGDCCSSSYIESIDDISIFQDAILLEVDDVSGEEKQTDDYNVLKWTFYKFKTSKGMATLSFRNESNGYYDGHLELVSWPTNKPAAQGDGSPQNDCREG